MAFELVELLRFGVDLHAQSAGCFVDEVDGLVGQLAVADVAVAELGGGDYGAIGHAHAVMDFVAFLETAQDGDGILDGGFANEDGLEAAFESGVFFDMFAILVEGGGADGMKLAAGQHGLEHVGGVHRALGGTGADERVHLVNEEEDLAFGVADFVENGLEPLLELAAVLGPGHQRAQVERDQTLVFQDCGHVAVDDALGQALGDSGLADAGFADEDGVVLGAAAEDLHDAADFLIAADDGIEVTFAGFGGQVATVFCQGFILGFGGLAGDALAAAHGGQALHNGVVVDAVALQQLADGTVSGRGHRHEEMLGGGVLVLHVGGDGLGFFEKLCQIAAYSHFHCAAADA